MTKHLGSAGHRTAVASCEARLEQNRPIQAAMGISIAEINRKKKRNRQHIMKIFSLVKTMMKQKLAFRGHKEHDELHNRGNSIVVLQLISEFDPDLKEWLNNGPGNALYTSPQIQNEMIGITGR